MTDHLSIELIERALHGELPPELESAFHEHVELCPDCAAAMESVSGVDQIGPELRSLLQADDYGDAVPSRDDYSATDFVVDHLEPSDSPDSLGQLGGYEILEVVGRGGMGVVLKGYDRELKRFVAIKALAPHLAHNSLARKRFAREAQAAAAVVNLHVIAIHQVQPNGRLPFLVMPLLSGESLAQRLKARGMLELKEVLRIGMQAAEGLAAAHEQGLVHRDVKPANILLEKGIERAVLTDFGLARAADDVSLTRMGMIAGTPEYMSPEQAKGDTVDARSDLFSLGCILYEMATGTSPFRTETPMATLRRIVDEAPRAITSLNPELPEWFAGIVDRLLSKSPESRFDSARTVANLLGGCLAHVQQPSSVQLPREIQPSVRQTRVTHSAGTFQRLFPWMIAAIIVLSLVIGGGSFLGMQHISERDAKSQSKRNLAKISDALQAFRKDHGDRFPPSVAEVNGAPPYSWRVALLPYLGHQDLFDAYHFNEPWNSPHNKTLLKRIPDVYRSPFDDSTNTSYFGVVLAGNAQKHAIALIEDDPQPASPQGEPTRRIDISDSVRAILKEKPNALLLNLNPFDATQVIRYADRQFVIDLIAVAENAAKNAKDKGDSIITTELVLHRSKARLAELDRNPVEQLKQLQIVRVLFDLLWQQSKHGEYVFLTRKATDLVLRPRLAETHVYIATLKNDLHEQVLCLEDWAATQATLVQDAGIAQVNPQTADRDLQQIRRWLSAARARRDQVTDDQTLFSDANGTHQSAITNGAANTIALVEKKLEIPWTKPEDVRFDPQSDALQFGGWYRTGWYAAMADGSVRWFPNDAENEDVRKLFTVSDAANTTTVQEQKDERATSPTAVQMAAMLDLLTRFPQQDKRTIDELKKLSLAQFEAVAVLRELKFRKSSDREGEVRFYFLTGDDHTVIVMFRGNKWSGVQRVRGEHPSIENTSGVLVPAAADKVPLSQDSVSPRVFISKTVDVTGTTEGFVWGTDIYTSDSNLGKAAVHAGLLKIGESSQILIEVVDALNSYEGSTRNGVTSRSYGRFETAIRLHKTQLPTEALTSFPQRSDITTAKFLSSDRSNATRTKSQIGETTIVELTGSTAGRVWGTDVYTDNSDLAAAAVHSGLVAVDQKRWIGVVVVESPQAYEGTDRNGVKSIPYGEYPTAIRLFDVTMRPEGTTRLPTIGNTVPLGRMGSNDLFKMFEDKPGTIVITEVKGALTGQVWGTDIYTGDSPVATAAVHAGLLKDDEIGWICRESVESPPVFQGTTRNDITTQSFNAYPIAYRLRRITGPAPRHRVSEYALHSELGANGPTLSLNAARIFVADPHSVSDPPGTRVIVELRGSTLGNVWGTDVYTADSDTATAAVHAGLLKPNEVGWISREVVPTQEHFTGSTRNGVTSREYGEFPIAIKLARVEPPIQKPTTLDRASSASPPSQSDRTLSPSVSVFNKQIGVRVLIKVKGHTGGSIWGSDIYTGDSDLGTAAVHSGLINVGDVGWIICDSVPPPPRFERMLRHEIESRSFGEYPWAFQLRGIAIPRAQSPDIPPGSSRITTLQDPRSFADMIGTRVAVRATGTTDGSVWGSELYTTDSHIGTAAVHAGLLNVGETAWIIRETVRPPDRFEGTERNGIHSCLYEKYPTAMKLSRVQEDVRLRSGDYGDPPLNHTESSGPSIGEQFRTQIIVEVTGSDIGSIWGTDTYTADSAIAVAAVHAGLLKVGETGWIICESVPSQGPFESSTRYGLSSQYHSHYDVAYRLRRYHPPERSRSQSTLRTDSRKADSLRETFLRQAGPSTAAEQLYERIVADPKRAAVLSAVVEVPERRGKLYASELWRVWRDAAQAKEDGGIPAVDAAFCFYLGCDPATAKSLSDFPAPPDATDGFRAHETMLISTAVREELNRAETQEPIARLFARWTACRTDPFVRELAIETARTYRVKEMLSVVRTMSVDATFEPRFRAAAITLLADLGGDSEVPTLCRLLDDTSECYVRSLSIKGENAPTAIAQIRDIALGCLIVLAKESFADAGIDEYDWHKPTTPFSSSELFRMAPFGFFTPASRNTAHDKWDNRLVMLFVETPVPRNAVRLRIDAPARMTLQVGTADASRDESLDSPFERALKQETPAILDVDSTKLLPLRLTDIANRPGFELHPVIELLDSERQLRSIGVSLEAIPIEFTDDDFDRSQMNKSTLKLITLNKSTDGTPSPIEFQYIEKLSDIDQARSSGAIPLAVIQLRHHAVREATRDTPTRTQSKD